MRTIKANGNCNRRCQIVGDGKRKATSEECRPHNENLLPWWKREQVRRMVGIAKDEVSHTPVLEIQVEVAVGEADQLTSNEASGIDIVSSTRDVADVAVSKVVGW